MPAEGFEIVTEQVAATASLRLWGELDVAQSDRVSVALHDARESGAESIEVDLRELTFIDSSGLRTLLAIHKQAEADDFTYSMLAGPPEVHRTFVMAGLDQVFRFVPAARGS